MSQTLPSAPLFDEAIEDLHSLRDFMRLAMTSFAAYAVHYGHGTDNALDEAAYLILQALHLPADLDSNWLDARLCRSERQRLAGLIRQRCIERIPTAYLVNRAWFAGLEFHADARALVPRSPLAELIQQGFAPWVEPDRVQRILDLCTGGGSIALACAHYFPEAMVDATDLSADALALAHENRAALHLDEQVELLQGDLFAPVAGRRYDLIVSNPPYVDATDMFDLPDEFRHEPELALAAGDDGLILAKRILATAADRLTDGGVLVVEVGNSYVHLQQQFPDVPFTWVEFEQGGHGVFVITKAQLDAYGEQFAAYRS